VVIAIFSHGAKLFVPTVAWMLGRANNQLLRLHHQLYFFTQAALVKEQLGDANTMRAAYFDNTGLDNSIHINISQCTMDKSG
jgi:hypothetical protein